MVWPRRPDQTGSPHGHIRIQCIAGNLRLLCPFQNGRRAVDACRKDASGGDLREWSDGLTFDS